MLWGIRLIRTGIMRAFGGSLRHVLGAITNGRIMSFGVGAGVTVFIQSSTATAMIIASLASKGLVGAPAALAVMLGADVGTSVAAQILSFDLSTASYGLIFVGFVIHSQSVDHVKRQIGRSILGLGMVLLALSLIRMSSAPLRDSALLVDLLTTLESEMLLTLFIVAVLTWLIHSSLAVVLLTASLYAAGVIQTEMGLLMILGANIGGTIPAIIATMNAEVEGQRVAMGNAVFKLTACLLVLPILHFKGDILIGYLGETHALINFHTVFNIFVAVLFLPWVGVFARLFERLIPATEQEGAERVVRYLDRDLLETPTLALASASRELNRIPEQIEEALLALKTAVLTDDLATVTIAMKNHANVAATLDALKFYLSDVTRGEISDNESDRAMNMVLLSANLGHVSELVLNAVTLCEARIRDQVRFSNEGRDELLPLIDIILQGLRHTLVSSLQGDSQVRKNINKQRKELDNLVEASWQAHFRRLSEGNPSAISTSGLHSELLRDFTRIFYHIHAASKVGI
ncbi:phosphate:Na+ symporter [Loktanella ponticola]|uniref:Phosphate:Na+ symporter n=2 Tax=Yoonia ponticola TaxID=1524255 RepID=A0A7W9BP97_9RHOB|nr:phosphate:Na+ symporter [Yoonia ponticola]